MDEPYKFALEVARTYFDAGMKDFIEGKPFDVHGAQSIRDGYRYAQSLLNKLRKSA